jgi:hypothetical protein
MKIPLFYIYMSTSVLILSRVLVTLAVVSRFIGSSPGGTTINYNTFNPAVTTPHKIKTSFLTSVSELFSAVSGYNC